MHLIKCLSLHQPFAELMARTLKCYETRSWGANYVGPLAIHAAKKKYDTLDFGSRLAQQLEEDGVRPDDMEYGGIVAVGTLVKVYDCDRLLRKTLTAREETYGTFSDGRFAWKVSDIQRRQFIPYRGMQGLFNVPRSLLERAGYVL